MVDVTQMTRKLCLIISLMLVGSIVHAEEEIDVNEQEVVDYKEVSPLDLTIAELQKRAVERREKMKNFN